MKIKTVNISTLSSYLAQIEKVTSNWASHYSEVWYRGIGSTEYGLVPGTVWRKVQEGQSITEDFLIHYSAYQNGNGLEAWELYTLMQHYGLPTRLLDWTKKPLIALYFALEEEPKASTERQNKRAVWMMNSRGLNRITSTDNLGDVDCTLSNPQLDVYLPAAISNRLSPNTVIPEKPIALTVPLSNQRVISQEGAFTVHGNDSKTIDEYFTEHNSDQITKLIIKEEHRDDIRNQLFSLGYKEDYIYQDLNSLSKRIIREWGI